MSKGGDADGDFRPLNTGVNFALLGMPTVFADEMETFAADVANMRPFLRNQYNEAAELVPISSSSLAMPLQDYLLHLFPCRERDAARPHVARLARDCAEVLAGTRIGEEHLLYTTQDGDVSVDGNYAFYLVAAEHMKRRDWAVRRMRSAVAQVRLDETLVLMRAFYIRWRSDDDRPK